MSKLDFLSIYLKFPLSLKHISCAIESGINVTKVVLLKFGGNKNKNKI